VQTTSTSIWASYRKWEFLKIHYKYAACLIESEELPWYQNSGRPYSWSEGYDITNKPGWVDDGYKKFCAAFRNELKRFGMKL
jgi:hypothetical protein